MSGQRSVTCQMGRRPRSCVVVGSGFVGTACALQLQHNGVSTILVDRGDARKAASFGNIGHIAIEQCAPLVSAENIVSFPAKLFALGGPLDFRLSALASWGPWALHAGRYASSRQFWHGTAVLSELLEDALSSWDHLLALAGASDLLRKTGHGMVWMKAPAFQRGKRDWCRAGAWPSRRVMTPEELERYAGVLGRRPAGGILFDGTAQVSEPAEVLAALTSAFIRAGGRTVQGYVEGLERRGEGVTVKLASGQELTSDIGLIAAGAWSASLFQRLGMYVPLVAERGYSVQAPKHVWPPELPLTVFPESSTVIARFSKGSRIAGFVEFAQPDTRPDPRKWAALFKTAERLGVPFPPDSYRWSGARPTLPDYLPAIGRLHTEGNIYYAFGHQHLGLTLAAVTANHIVNAVLHGAELSPDLSLDRFIARGGTVRGRRR